MSSTPQAPLIAVEMLDDRIADLGCVFMLLLNYVQLRYEDINADGGVFFVGWNKWRWGEPKEGAQPHVGTARQAWGSLSSLVAQAVRRSAPERLRQLEGPSELFRRIIEHDDERGAPAASVDGIRVAVSEALNEVRELLHGLPSAHGPGGRLLVPDTNALLYKPELADWTPPDGPWTVVLVPQVLRELDQIKMRPNELGKKADGVIRRIKEYSRRGDTFVSVRISDLLAMREVAIDPDMASTLPWLQAGHADDELLASALELRGDNLNAALALATRDRNLQNKARLASVPYLDVEFDL